MKQSKWHILSNQPVAHQTYRMVLQGDTSAMQPGQFVEIALPDCFLRRPISVCDIEDDRLTIVYKVVGRGTAVMAQMHHGELDLLSGLGNGYNLTKAGEEALLIGGGVGVPPLVYAARRLRQSGKEVRVVMGFNSAREVFAEDVLTALGCRVEVCTMDGSYGTRGVVTDLLSAAEPFYYACGPLPMLKAVIRKIGVRGQVSMEERMGCGVGVCMGCSIKTRQGVKRVCKEGPVFDVECLMLNV